jgi:hypothetical protein
MLKRPVKKSIPSKRQKFAIAAFMLNFTALSPDK